MPVLSNLSFRPTLAPFSHSQIKHSLAPQNLHVFLTRVPHHVSQSDVVYKMNELWFACCLMLIKLSQCIPGHEANEVHKQTDTFVISPAYVWEELWNINVVMLV